MTQAKVRIKMFTIRCSAGTEQAKPKQGVLTAPKADTMYRVSPQNVYRVTIDSVIF